MLKYLAENGQKTTLSDLAEHLASIETNKPNAPLSSKERKRIYVSLDQVQLPNMDDTNVIDYNQPRGCQHMIMSDSAPENKAESREIRYEVSARTT